MRYIITIFFTSLITLSFCQTGNSNNFFGINLSHKIQDFGYSSLDLYGLQVETDDPVAVPLNKEYYQYLDRDFLAQGYDVVNVLFASEPNSNEIVGVYCLKKFNSINDYDLSVSYRFESMLSILIKNYGEPDESMKKKGIYQNHTWKSNGHTIVLSTRNEDHDIELMIFLF